MATDMTELAPNTRARKWCVTWNNYTEEDCESFKAMAKSCSYIVCNKEVAPTTGTPHLQGYLHLKNAMSWSALRKKMPTAFLIVAGGSDAQNRDYIYKVNDPEQRVEEVWFEEGEKPKKTPGSRTDLVVCREMVKAGMKKAEIADALTSMQSVKSMDAYIQIAEKPRNFKTEVRWFWGNRKDAEYYAAQWLDDSDAYVTDNLDWWQRYDADENVMLCIEPTVTDQSTMKMVHRLCGLAGDRMYTLNLKGTSRQFLAKKLAIVADAEPFAQFHLAPRHIVCNLTDRIEMIQNALHLIYAEDEERVAQQESERVVKSVTEKIFSSVINGVPPTVCQEANVVSTPVHGTGCDKVCNDLCIPFSPSCFFCSQEGCCSEAECNTDSAQEEGRVFRRLQPVVSYQEDDWPSCDCCGA